MQPTHHNHDKNFSLLTTTASTTHNAPTSLPQTTQRFSHLTTTAATAVSSLDAHHSPLGCRGTEDIASQNTLACNSKCKYALGLIEWHLGSPDTPPNNSSNGAQRTFITGERSQKPASHINPRAMLNGQARKQIYQFFAAESGRVGLLLMVVSEHQ